MAIIIRGLSFTFKDVIFLMFNFFKRKKFRSILTKADSMAFGIKCLVDWNVKFSDQDYTYDFLTSELENLDCYISYSISQFEKNESKNQADLILQRFVKSKVVENICVIAPQNLLIKGLKKEFWCVFYDYAASLADDEDKRFIYKITSVIVVSEEKVLLLEFNFLLNEIDTETVQSKVKFWETLIGNFTFVIYY